MYQQSAQCTVDLQNLMTTPFSCHTDVSTVPLTAQWELQGKGTGCCDCTAVVLVLDLKNNLKIKIYRTIILPVVLYGCESWSLTLWEEQAEGV
jgi:hypothetical protein